ncbi:ABC transporter substrate-binding protein [Paenibacillus oenotherae]|uniref:ABC transporter substrate-binding protein n=1 Tax=Paenibacillus oenotherae TaxID=1435645 RepID=A0ABS7DA87_9BACL|nr:ABC transporter substrate-binding protein [Paenibacillus oenotherae]MBW7476852.1 ABC transporter substrate-binding protein [Paenibacillus oenotherae]
MKEPVKDWESQLAGRPPIKNGFTSDLEHKVRERIRMRQRKNKSAFRAVAALMSIVIILGGGWWFRDDWKGMLNLDKPEDALTALLNDPLGDKEVTLSVQLMMYRDFDQIKKPFIIRHPSVTIETIMTEVETMHQPEKFKAFVDKANPDIFMLPVEIYSAMAAEGKLKSLDTLFKQHKFDLEAYHAPLVEMLRLAGGGELYGFTTDFNSSTLLVNRGLFQEQGIALPEAGASIDDILNTAARFKGTGVYGLVTGSGSMERGGLSGFATFIGQSSGLKTLSYGEDKVEASLQSEGWKGVWQRLVDGYKDGWLGESKPIDWSKGAMTNKQIYSTELFANGKTAMIIADDRYYKDLLTYEAATKKPMDWISVPFKLDPGVTNPYDYLSANYVYAINAKSTNEEAAWELLRFIVGKETADKYDRIGDRGPNLLARSAAMKSQLKEKWNGYYGMGVDPERAASGRKDVADGRYIESQREFIKLGKEQMDAVVKGTKTVESALSELQGKLDAFLAGLGGRGGENNE